ncbi:hypothetical protein [Leptolyngbya ohadii]|uniref:hypothetical protein n=1 Tax=Leptolyngbya ohadii TaxID=1962290 RepID=UPI001CEDA191|nr:hypothetical protein [Leptolyngbya ohadii]
MPRKQCLRSILLFGYEGLRHSAAQIPGALDDHHFAKGGNPALELIALEEIVHAPFAEPQNRGTGFNLANSRSTNTLLGDRLQPTSGQ